MTMKVLSWNVNGLRALVQRDGLRPLAAEGADVICLQETKATSEQTQGIPDGYPHQFWSFAEQKGYSGTAVLSRVEPLSVRMGLGSREHDSEGRLISLEFRDFWLVTVYTPNAGRGLVRLDYRLEWDKAFLRYLRRLEKSKPVVFCGDLNVAHEEIDIANPRANRRNAGFTDEERESFSRILRSGFADTFRELHPEPGQYTWWSYMYNARAKNIGWRIDYVCVSRSLLPRLRGASILAAVMGSDHCPVAADLA
jgi:exodeoxyribonuclease-3